MKGFQFRYARTTTILLLILVVGRTADGQEKAPGAPAVPRGFTSLFNGQDFTGWTLPEGDNGHWKVLDGVIDYDALSEASPLLIGPLICRIYDAIGIHASACLL